MRRELRSADDEGWIWCRDRCGADTARTSWCDNRNAATSSQRSTIGAARSRRCDRHSALRSARSARSARCGRSGAEGASDATYGRYSERAARCGRRWAEITNRVPWTARMVRHGQFGRRSVDGAEAVLRSARRGVRGMRGVRGVVGGTWVALHGWSMVVWVWRGARDKRMRKRGTGAHVGARRWGRRYLVQYTVVWRSA